MEWLPLSKDRMQDLIKLWNQELVRSFPISERMIEQNIFQDNNFLPEGSWMVLDHHSRAVIGFVVAKLWKDRVHGIDLCNEKGWIQAMLVDSNYRNQGIGSALLSKAEQALSNNGINRVCLGDDLYRRFFPGIPDSLTQVKQWFEKRGYVNTGITHDMTERYEEGASVDLLEFEDVRFVVAQPKDRERMIDFMKRCFPGAWEYQSIQYWDNGGTGREFVLLEKEGEIGGFCRINDSHSPLLAQNIYWSPLFDGELGGIGPLGIDQNYRGQRYGLAVVQAGIHYLLERGVRHIVIDTTRFIDFYGKLGYKVWRSYSIYNKHL